jgi:hypothetical protein
MAGSCEFRTSEASTKAWIRTRSVIDKYLNILNVGQFRIFNRELSELAEEKFGALSKTNNTRLFEEERIGDRYVAVPNKEVFKAIDNAKGIFYQQPSDVTQQAIPELDKFLLDFIQKFGVSVNEINNFKERFGVDALGATDILNKAIYYATNRNAETIPEEFGHMITMIMGKGNPDMAALMGNIEQWEGYQKVYDEYMPIYNSVNRVKFEAVGKLLAKSLVKNFSKKEKLNPTLLEKVLDVIKSFLNKITRFKVGKMMQSTTTLADKIATNVLAGNVDYIKNFGEQDNSNSKVRELFDLNPELVNEIYNALGFTEIVKFKRDEVRSKPILN